MPKSKSKKRPKVARCAKACAGKKIGPHRACVRKCMKK